MPAPIPITSYREYNHYFESIAFQNLLLNGAIHIGDSWRIIGRMRSRINYPAMWLERPVIEITLDNDDDTPMARLKGALSIVGGVATDDWDGQEALLQLCNTIARQVIARLKRDADLNYFDLEFPITAEPLATVMADDCYGWRIEYTIPVRDWTECFDEANWQNLDWNGDFEGIGFWFTEEYIVQ